MRVRYQRGYLRPGQRKKGPDRWEFLWWDNEANGTRVRRKADFTSTHVDFTSLEPGFVLQERIAGPEVRSRDSQMRAHLGLNQVAHRPVSSAILRR
jgi:hypothetical protein